jgi:TPR repeat protein
MQKKSRKLALVSAVGIAITAITPTSYVLSDHPVVEEKDLFMMEEAAMDYWLRGGIGYCGAEMRPDFDEIKQAARDGNSIAAFRLGQVYSSGTWGMEQDDKEAVKWFRMAAEAGHLESMLKMGLAYELGKGIGQDNKQAAEWYWQVLRKKGNDAILEEKIRVLESGQ